MKKVMQKLTGALGYEMSRSKHGYFRHLFKNNKFDHLIDVGANRGQFLSFIRSAGYSGAATAFEPIAEYKEDIERIGNVRVFVNALGKARSSMDMNIYSSTDFSSFHSLNHRYTREYPSAPAVKDTRRIDVLTLDELDISGSNIFLKVDAQGSDADVLRGASRTLERVGLLVLELPFLKIYDGGCSAADLFLLTEMANLFPSRFFANSITACGAWVDGDVVFVKMPEDEFART
jgi:FkbM family methyltransferase